MNLDLAFAIGYSNGADSATSSQWGPITSGNRFHSIPFSMESLVDRALPKETNPLAVLQIHGTEDEVILTMEEKGLRARLCSVTKSAALWALVNECADKPEMRPKRRIN